MPRKTKFEKGKDLVKSNKVELEKITNNFEYYKVSNKKTYEVIFNKQKNIYSCTCKNIRNTSCYHIEAVKIFREVFHLEKTKKKD